MKPNNYADISVLPMIPETTTAGQSYPAFAGSGIRSIPVNHNVCGTCGKCGGPIIAPIFFASSAPGDAAPEWCMDCGAIPKKEVRPDYGPIREMH